MTAARSEVAAGVTARLPYLDGFRGLAALGVLAFHVSGYSGWVATPDWSGLDGGAWMLRLGNVAVCIFFLLSGAVLYRPFAATHLRGEPLPRLGPYLTRRALRIFPAYLLARTAFTVLGLMPELQTPVTPREWVSQYVLMQNYVHRGFETSLPVAWTLCVELSFYLLLPVLAVGIRRLPGGRSGAPRDRVRAQLAGLGLLYLAGWAYRIAILELSPRWPGSPPNWLPTFLDWFALGMTLAVLHAWRAEGGGLPRWLTALADVPWLCWLFALQLYWISVQIRIPANFAQDGPKTLARFGINGAIALLLLLPAVLGTRRTRGLRLLESPVAVFAGTISYGLYLWHTIVLRWSQEQGVRLDFGPRLALTTLATVVLAYATYRVVELPAMSWRRRQAPRETEPVAASPQPALAAQ